MADNNLQARFEEAAEKARALEGVAQEDQLKLYVWFKQVKDGDQNAERPNGWFDFEAKAKWDARDKVRGTSKEEAMEKYIAEYERIAGN